VSRFLPISDCRLQIADLKPRSICHLPSAICNLLLVLVAGCDLPGRPDPADRPVPANEVLDFKVLYGENCAGCHGAKGRLGAGPPLNDSLFRAIVPEEELQRIITKGREKTLMPAFAIENGGRLTAAQVRVLVKEIKGVSYRIMKKGEGGESIETDVSPQWGLCPQPPKGVPDYLARSALHGNKQRGATVFARACAACHGEHGQGMEAGAIQDPIFLALISDQALRRYVITGRPDLGMPNYAEARPDDTDFKPLTDQDVTDLIELMVSWRREHATK
jgi:mono/diheme cytochrome c family protein